MRTINGLTEDEWKRRVQLAFQAVNSGKNTSEALALVFPDRVFVSPANPAQPLTEAELGELLRDLSTRYGGTR